MLSNVGIKFEIMKTFFQALKNLAKKPVTANYPAEKTFIPQDYRGLIAFDESLCIWCRRCEMACPPGAIVFSQDTDGKQTYHYNRAVCIYCAECVRSCPKSGALLQTNQPAHCALKAENINNGWNTLYDEAVKSREVFAALKKKLAAEKAAAAKQGDKNEPSPVQNQ
jgi:formate hydrogenlyase subunit 6/NADH:ubiquinone oxidoreductase subunit I